LRFADALINLLHRGYAVKKVSPFTNNILFVILKVPLQHKQLKTNHILFANQEGYCISMICGACSFYQWEIYDDDKKFEDVERFNTFVEALNRISYYMRLKKGE